MNYAVIKTGGKQHKVEEGEIISIEKLNAEEGEKVEFEEVLAIKSEGKLQVGSPVIDGAKVTGTGLSQEKDKKVVIIKMRRRQDYRSKQGHRQKLTKVKIDSIKIYLWHIKKLGAAPEMEVTQILSF